MHDLLFLTLGITIGSLCTVALLALMRQAADDDYDMHFVENWDVKKLANWDGGSGPYDQDDEIRVKTVRLRRAENEGGQDMRWSGGEW